MGAVFKPAENVLLNVAGSFAGPGFRRGGFLKFGGKPTPAVAAQNAAHPAKVLQLRQEVAALRARQAETDRKLHKQAEMENELQQLRRALSELKKH